MFEPNKIWWDKTTSWGPVGWGGEQWWAMMVVHKRSIAGIKNDHDLMWQMKVGVEKTIKWKKCHCMTVSWCKEGSSEFESFVDEHCDDVSQFSEGDAPLLSDMTQQCGHCPLSGSNLALRSCRKRISHNTISHSFMDKYMQSRVYYYVYSH